MERHIEELQAQIQQEEVKNVETERFIALVKKYRDCKELTDTMLYAFIDRIEVHEATGGRTIYRQQNLDIHFNFIGNYYPPVETISEEERIAVIEAEQLRKKKEKGQRSAERRKKKIEALGVYILPLLLVQMIKTGVGNKILYLFPINNLNVQNILGILYSKDAFFFHSFFINIGFIFIFQLLIRVWMQLYCFIHIKHWKF